MRTKKAVYNLISNISFQIVATVTGLILPRLIIVTYGSSINGLIVSIKQFIAYLTLVEAGVAAASIYALYKPLNGKLNDKINSIIAATQRFYNQSGRIFLILAAILVLIYPLVIRENLPYFKVALIILILAGSGVFEYFFFAKYRVLLTADQKGYIVSLLQAGSMIISTTVSAVLILFGTNILLVLFVTTAIYISRGIILRNYVRSFYPYLDVNVKPDIKALDKHWDALAHQIQGMVVSGSSIILITIFCGLEDVSIYSIYFLVFSAITMLVLSFSNGLAPGFGDIMASGDSKVLEKTYNEYESFFYMILTWVYTTTALIIMPFIQLYTKGITDAQYLQPLLALLFLIIGVTSNIRIPHLTLVTAAGHFRETRSRAIFETVINLVASLIFIQMFGMIGALFGSLCSYLYRTTDFIFYSNKRILSRNPIKTVKCLLLNLLPGSILFVCFKYLLTIEINTWIHWIFWAITISIISLVVIVSINYIFEPSIMRSLASRLKSILGRKRNQLFKY